MRGSRWRWNRATAAARALFETGKERGSKLQSQRCHGIRHMALLTQGRPEAGSHLRVSHERFCCNDSPPPSSAPPSSVPQRHRHYQGAKTSRTEYEIAYGFASSPQSFPPGSLQCSGDFRPAPATFITRRRRHPEPVVRRISQVPAESISCPCPTLRSRPVRLTHRNGQRSAVAGYSCYNDGSVRDWQKHTIQFIPGKNFPSTGGFGPWLVTRDELGDPSHLSLTTRLNGEVVQQARTDDLIFDIPTLIEYCSTFTELHAGDVIITGTTGGVGAFRQPPLWMKADDVVEVEISKIGILRNVVVDETRSSRD